MSLTFVRGNGEDLYLAEGADASVGPYFLLSRANDGLPNQVDFRTTWAPPRDPRKPPPWRGAYLFVGAEIPASQRAAFAKSVRSKLFGGGATNWTQVAWFSAPDPDSITANLQISNASYFQPPRIIQTRKFSLGLFSFETQFAVIDADFSADALAIRTRNQSPMRLRMEDATSQLVMVPGGITIAMTGETAGTVTFAMALDRWALSSFGGDVRYFTPAKAPLANGNGNGGEVLQTRYPLFDLSESGQTAPTDTLAVTVHADPLRPYDPARSRMAFASESIGVRYPSYLFTTTGGKVWITPTADAGLVPQRGQILSKLRPPTFTDGQYWAPSGPFKVFFSADGGASGDGAQIMCGTSGAEFIRAAEGDRLVFSAGLPAWAPHFTPNGNGNGAANDGSSNGEAPLTSDRYTTAWLTVAETAAAQAATGADFGYYGQPSDSIYYGQLVPAKVPLLGAMEIKLSALTATLAAAISAGATPAGTFPMAFYGGLLAVTSAQRKTPFNPGIDLETTQRFEEQILTKVRRAKVPELPDGPLFKSSPAPTTATFAGLTTAAPQRLAKSMTPQGFLALTNQFDTGDPKAKFNDTWNTLTLAKDPSGTSHDVSFTGTTPEGVPLVARPLSNALMHPTLFMVISRPENIGTFNDRVVLDRFSFNLAPVATKIDGTSGGAETIGPVLIFKFLPGKLIELAADPALWTAPATFNDQAPDQSFPVQAFLQTTFDKALASKDPRLDHFKRIIQDPFWSGVLAVNCAIGGDGLPLEMRGLLAGLDAPLRGHHIGININQIELKPDTPPEIARSSIFGLIAYPPPGAATGDDGNDMAATAPSAESKAGEDYAYEVKELFVLFENSALAEFSCTVWLTLNSLFGRAAALQKETLPPNTFEINGHYEKHGDQGTFTFRSSSESVFTNGDDPTEVVRALEAVRIARAQFNTLSSTPKPENSQEIKARFALEGGLAFRQDAFKQGDDPGLDLFGYGVPSNGFSPTNAGLVFSNLNLDIQFVLLADGGVETGTFSITFNPDLSLDLGASGNQSAGGRPRNGSFAAGLPITITRFLHDTEKGLGPDELGGQTVYCKQIGEKTTGAPFYVFDFEMPLGSLGALSSVHVNFTAHVFLGWGPNPASPDDDAAGLVVQLPTITPGFKSFDLHGVLKLSFGTANLAKLGGLYVLSFNNVGLSLLTLKLPPGYIVDLLLFADPNSTANAASARNNLGWYVAITPDAAKVKDTPKPRPLAGPTPQAAALAPPAPPSETPRKRPRKRKRS